VLGTSTTRASVALPGYQTFETDISPLANQNVEIKTDLVKNGAPLAGPLVKTDASAATPSVVTPKPANGGQGKTGQRLTSGSVSGPGCNSPGLLGGRWVTAAPMPIKSASGKLDIPPAGSPAA
jgi:hypothetical protein